MKPVATLSYRLLVYAKGVIMSNQRATISEAEFAKAVGLSRVTVWRLRLKGLVPHYQIGSRILYGQQHIDQFLKAHEKNLIDSSKGIYCNDNNSSLNQNQ